MHALRALTINTRSGSIDLVRMRTFRTPGILVCASALLLALGTYLATMEVPVRITYDPAAAEQYDLMRAYLPFGFAFWILSLVFLVCGFVLGARKPLAVAQLKKPFSRVSIIVGGDNGRSGFNFNLLTLGNC